MKYRIWQTLSDTEGVITHTNFWQKAPTFKEAHELMLSDYDIEEKRVYLGPCDFEEDSPTMWMLRVDEEDGLTRERGIVKVAV